MFTRGVTLCLAFEALADAGCRMHPPADHSPLYCYWLAVECFPHRWPMLGGTSRQNRRTCSQKITRSVALSVAPICCQACHKANSGPVSSLCSTQQPGMRRFSRLPRSSVRCFAHLTNSIRSCLVRSDIFCFSVFFPSYLLFLFLSQPRPLRR